MTAESSVSIQVRPSDIVRAVTQTVTQGRDQVEGSGHCRDAPGSGPCRDTRFRKVFCGPSPKIRITRKLLTKVLTEREIVKS